MSKIAIPTPTPWRTGALLALLLLLPACGSQQPGSDTSLIQKVCDHAMQIATRDQIGDFTMELCLEEVSKRADTLRGGFHGWANCLLNTDSIVEAKNLCRERDFMQGM